MRVIKLVDKDGHALPPGKDGHTHAHHGDGHRCISPFFGLYVSVGVCATGWAGWKVLGALWS